VKIAGRTCIRGKELSLDEPHLGRGRLTAERLHEWTCLLDDGRNDHGMSSGSRQKQANTYLIVENLRETDSTMYGTQLWRE
jgi:hypothetical protein